MANFTNFHYFHNIPYANGLQFAKVFSAKLPTVLIRQTFLLPFFYYTVIGLRVPCSYIHTLPNQQYYRIASKGKSCKVACLTYIAMACSVASVYVAITAVQAP